MTYYNTTNVSGEELRRYRLRAKSQEMEIARIFRENDKAYAPHQIAEILCSAEPLTSIRRAITNLTDRGVLEKTNQKIAGPLGRPVGMWRAKR